MQDLLKDPVFFYAIAFAVFVGLAFAKGRKPLASWLDAEIAKIADELEQARKLRAEAETVLTAAEARHAAAMAESESIVRYAQDEAARLKAKAEADLTERLALQEKLAIDHIRRVEAATLADIRRKLVADAIQSATLSLTDRMDPATAARLMDQAIDDLPAQIADTGAAKAA